MSETIWAQANPTGVSGYSSTTESNATYGLYFTVAQAVTLTAIWFYSPSGATVLPTTTGVWSTTNGTSGTLLNSNTASWSGAAGSGWVRDTSFPATPLVSGTVYVAGYYGNSTYGQAYLYTGGGGAGPAWFPSTSGPGNITAPLSEFGNVQAPYKSSSGGLAFPATVNGHNLNWLLDVEVTVSQPTAAPQFPWHPPRWIPGLRKTNAQPFAQFPLTRSAPAPQPPGPTGPWTLFGALGNGATGPASATSNSTAQVQGIQFQATSGVQWFEGFWYWCCNSGQSTSPVTCALWNCYATPSFTGTLVPGTTVTSGTLTAGAWNWIPLAAPVPLAPGTCYIAAVGVTGNYPDTANQFGSGDPYAAGITNGPLSAFGYNGGSNPSPYSTAANCASNATGSNPAVTMPGAALANYDNIWLDVQITSAVPASYKGTYRLWPNNSGADSETSSDAAVDYVIGTEFRLPSFWNSPVVAQQYQVYRVWFYSPAGTAELPTNWDIWNIATGLAVASGTSLTWSGAAGSGWVHATVTGVVLSAGAYRVSVYNSSGSPDAWSAKRLGYWGVYQGGAAPGGGGITSGPLYAPPTALASNTLNYNSSDSGATPPYSSGQILPGQSVFSQSGSDSFPQLYVGPSGTTPSLYQNYWVDIELIPMPSASVQVTAAITAGASLAFYDGATPTFTAHRTAAANAVRLRSVTRTVTAAITAVGSVFRHRSASRTTTVTVTAVGSKGGNTHAAGATPSFTAARTAVGTAIRHRTSSRNETATVTAIAGVFRRRSAARNVTATITAGAATPGGGTTATRTVTVHVTAATAHSTSRGASATPTAVITAHAISSAPPGGVRPPVMPQATSVSSVTPQAT